MAATLRLSARVSSLRPTAVNTVLGEVRELQAAGRRLVSLMRGEPDFRTPAHIADAAARALAEGRTGYPDNRGEPKLREAIALKLERDNGLRYEPGSEVLVATGATMGIYVALTALLDQGDEVLLPEPAYDAYQSPIRMAGGIVKPVPSPVVNGRFVPDMDALEAACGPRSRILLINTPWNPTGTVLTGEEIARIQRFVERRDLYLLSDEIYEAITYGAARHISPAAGLRERTVLINSLSKTYAMTGWRVGYCAAPAAITQAMFLVLQQSSRGPATFVQDAATVALTGPQDCVNAMREEYAARREIVIQSLDGLRGCRVLAPEGGFFAMLDVSGLGLPSNEVRRRLLRENGVVVMHGAAYGAAGEGTLRISFGSGGETLGRGVDLLREGLRNFR